MKRTPRPAPAAALAALLCAACTGSHVTLSPIPNGFTAHGEDIHVILKSGSRHDTKFVLVARDTIRFNGQALESFEIDRIVQKEFSPGRTALLSGGVAALLLGSIWYWGAKTGDGPFGGAK